MYKKITRQQLEKFLARYASPERVLDIGAGGSSYNKFFPNRVSIDIDPARYPDVVGDAHKLPFKEGEFNMILCTEVLEHLKDPRLAASEMQRVLAVGGVLILTTRFVYPIHDAPNDYWRFTKYGLQELFKNWEIIELTPETDNFSTVAVLLQRIVFQSSLHWNKLTKFLLLGVGAIVNRLNFLTKDEYGDIQKKKKEDHIMPSGYYLICKKIQ